MGIICINRIVDLLEKSTKMYLKDNLGIFLYLVNDEFV